MMWYKEVKREEVQFESLVGMSVLEFEWLHNLYAVEWEHYISRYTLTGAHPCSPHPKRQPTAHHRGSVAFYPALSQSSSAATASRCGLRYDPAAGQPLDSPVAETYTPCLAKGWSLTTAPGFSNQRLASKSGRSAH